MSDKHIDPTAEERAAARLAIARQLVVNEAGRLVDRRGTAWDFRQGRAFTTATHSRFDVLEAGSLLTRMLETLQLITPGTVALVEIAAIFHAAEGDCGDGAERALGAMRRWPAVFDEADRQAVAQAIEGLGPFEQPRADAVASPLPLQRTAQRLGTGITRASLRGMSLEDRVCAILADADRADIGAEHGPHRLLRRLIQSRRDVLGTSHTGHGRDLAPAPAVVQLALEELADAVDAHRWLLQLSDGLFDERRQTAQRLRMWALRIEHEGLAWRGLLDVADTDRGGRA